MQITAKTLTIDVAEQQVSALLLAPPAARVGYVLAHGAGAGMYHPSMEALANELAALGVASLRYQFPYMQRSSKRTDPPALCHATVRAAVAAAAKHLPDLTLIAGGRSFGGRMTSQAQALAPLPGVRGLAFFGFPLHPAGKPGRERAAHLSTVRLPMLFIQGAQDALATPALLESVIAELGARATLALLANADHALHVPRRSGRTDEEVRAEALATFVSWSAQLLAAD
jgi:predicted alpha/beta-hydrolase family hydrolase